MARMVGRRARRGNSGKAAASIIGDVTGVTRMA